MADYQSQFTGSEIDSRLAKVPQIVTELNGIEADIDSLEAAVQAINVGDYVTATTLPTASASTMGHIYLIGPDANNNYDRYFTQQSGSTYSWVPLGSTQIDLSTCATQAEVSQLEAKLNNLANTRYYGFFTSASQLPADASEMGYAYVGTTAPFAIYEFDGNDWENTGAVVNSIQGEPGVGFEDVETPTPADGTVIITLSNGNKVILDLNHNHGQYTKVQLCEDKEEYDAIASKDPMTFYLIPEVAMYLGETLILEQGNPLPYTPVAYIQSDGTAYINTGIKGNAPGSAEIKISPVTAGNFCYHLGCRAGTARFAPFTQWNASGQSYDNNLAFSYATSDTQGTSISTALSNHTPVLAKTILKSSLQKLSVSQDNGSTWVDFTPTVGSTTVTTALNMYLGACNNDGTANRIAPSGTRYHYVKIYSDDSFTTLVFDGVPCKYNNEYGLWDKVSNTFFGNAAGSGAFSGPNA